MTDLINDYIGKECLIYTCMSSSQIITRIREYPRDKKGKKKSVIFD